MFFLASSLGKLKMIGTDPAHTVTTLVAGGLGFGDGPGSSARLLPQGGMVWDGAALLVADAGNQRIRRIVPGTDANGALYQTRHERARRAEPTTQDLRAAYAENTDEAAWFAARALLGIAERPAAFPDPTFPERAPWIDESKIRRQVFAPVRERPWKS